MSKTYKLILAINLVLVLGLFSFSVIKKETLLNNGREILLRLAPVDPRSLMQGDYMRLDYQILRQIDYEENSTNKYIVVKVGSDNVAEYVRVQNDKNLFEGELLIRYKEEEWTRRIGAENYFFQEGTGDKYADAEYGLIKADADGNCMLIGLCNSDKQLIK